MQTACFLVFAICLANVCGQEEPPPLPLELQAIVYESQKPLTRVARQDIPKFPMPPQSDDITTVPIPNMPEFQPPSMNRKRREAKGIGGSMPTRKG